MNLNSSASGGTGTLSYTWATPNTAPISGQNPAITSVPLAAAGTYTLTVKDINNCIATGTNTTTVIINPAPALITGVPYAVITGASVQLSDGTPGGFWSETSSSIAIVNGSGVVTGVTPGTAAINYTTPGCPATTATITVIPAGVLCQGTTITLSDNVTGGTWSSSNVSAATVLSPSSGVIKGLLTGNSIITHAATGGYSRTYAVTVNPLTQITGNSTVCGGQTLTLYNTTVTGSTWASDNNILASVSPTGVVTGGSGTIGGTVGIYYITPVGCVASKTITVNPSVPITGIRTTCTGLTTTLANGVAGGTWSSSNAGYATVTGTGVVSGVAAGTPIISYSLPGGCLSTAQITVNPATPITGGTASMCGGQTSTFYNSTTGGAWSTANTSLATVTTTGIVTAGYSTTASAVNIVYTTNLGCVITKSLTVNAAQPITGLAAVCTGQTLALSNSIAGGTWSSSNVGYATVTNTGLVSVIGTGSPVISYSLPAGCITVASVTVRPMTVITGSAVICNGQTVTLANATGGGVWSSGNTTIATVSASGIVTPVALTGTVTVTYTANGCAESKVETVSPSSPITGASVVCQGQTATLSNSIAGGAWSSANLSNATVTGTGVVSILGTASPIISYTLPSGCVSVTTLTVSPLSPISGNSVVCGGQALPLYDGTTGGVWSSTNTSVATVSASGVVNPLYTMSTNTVGITYTGVGCSVSKTVTVNPNMPVTGTTTVCALQTTALANAIPSGNWSSSNPGYATVTAGTGVVSGVSAGSPLIISYTSPSGCISLASITVNPLSVITGSTTACTGRTIQLYNGTTGGGTWSTSTSAVATISASGLLSATISGAANVIFTTPLGCITNKTITVAACREADSTTGISTVITGIDNLILFPNPNKGTFNIKGALATEEDAEVSIEITDMLGQLVYRNTFTAHNGNINEQLQLVNTIANSMYLVNIRSGASQKVFHIVIER